LATWIVHRVTKDSRCVGGLRWQAIGWVNHETEEQAKDEAHKAFRRFNEEELRFVLTTPGVGYLA
jgi:hypothetical protein